MAALQPDPGRATLRQAEVRRVKHANNRLQPPLLFPRVAERPLSVQHSAPWQLPRAGPAARRPALRPARAAPAEFPSRGTLTARRGGEGSSPRGTRRERGRPSSGHAFRERSRGASLQNSAPVCCCRSFPFVTSFQVRSGSRLSSPPAPFPAGSVAAPRPAAAGRTPASGAGRAPQCLPKCRAATPPLSPSGRRPRELLRTETDRGIAQLKCPANEGCAAHPRCRAGRSRADSPRSAPAAACSFRRFGTPAAPCTACASCRTGQKEKNRKGHVVRWTSCLLAEVQATQSTANLHAEHMGCALSAAQSSGRRTRTHAGGELPGSCLRALSAGGGGGGAGRAGAGGSGRGERGAAGSAAPL